MPVIRKLSVGLDPLKAMIYLVGKTDSRDVTIKYISENDKGDFEIHVSGEKDSTSVVHWKTINKHNAVTIEYDTNGLIST